MIEAIVGLESMRRAIRPAIGQRSVRNVCVFSITMAGVLLCTPPDDRSATSVAFALAAVVLTLLWLVRFHSKMRALTEAQALDLARTARASRAAPRMGPIALVSLLLVVGCAGLIEPPLGGLVLGAWLGTQVATLLWSWKATAWFGVSALDTLIGFFAISNPRHSMFGSDGDLL
jgi:hypothetical protein